MAVTRLSQAGLGSRPYGANLFAGKETLSAREALWQNAKVLKRLESGDELTTARLPPGEWYILAKAQDTSGNYSSVAALVGVGVENQNNLVFESEQAPRWPGQVSGFVRHFLSGSLIPDSTRAANEHTKAELFEQFVPYPVAQCHYFAPEKDLGFDAAQLRVWAEINAALGRGKTGVADPQLYIDYRLDAESYDGFESWEIGSINARYLKCRATITTEDGVAILTGFKPVIDAGDHKEKFVSQAISIGGTTLDFTAAGRSRFFNPPLITITPSDSALIPYWTNKTESSVQIFLYDRDGNDVGGVADITAEEA